MIRIAHRYGNSTVSAGLFTTLCYVLLVWPLVVLVKVGFVLCWLLCRFVAWVVRCVKRRNSGLPRR